MLLLIVVAVPAMCRATEFQNIAEHLSATASFRVVRDAAGGGQAHQTAVDAFDSDAGGFKGGGHQPVGGAASSLPHNKSMAEGLYDLGPPPDGCVASVTFHVSPAQWPPWLSLFLFCLLCASV